MRLQLTVWQTTVEITSCTQELTWRRSHVTFGKKIFTKNVAILQETAYRFESSGELTVIIWKQGRKGSLSVCLRVWRQCLHVSDWNPSTTWSRNLRCRMKLLMFVFCFIFLFVNKRQVIQQSFVDIKVLALGKIRDVTWRVEQAARARRCVCAVSWNKCFLSFKACIFKECILSFRP